MGTTERTFSTDTKKINEEIESMGFVQAMGKCVTSVNIICTDGPGGKFGVTVSAMSSVSANPPLLLVCINRNNLAYNAIIENQCFSVNTLAEHQYTIAQVFAGQIKPESNDRFSCAEWDLLHTNSPVLSEALASFDCILEHHSNFGTHAIIVGRVKTVAYQDEGLPLAYAQQKFRKLIEHN